MTNNATPPHVHAYNYNYANMLGKKYPFTSLSFHLRCKEVSTLRNWMLLDWTMYGVHLTHMYTCTTYVYVDHIIIIHLCCNAYVNTYLVSYKIPILCCPYIIYIQSHLYMTWTIRIVYVFICAYFAAAASFQSHCMLIHEKSS